MSSTPAGKGAGKRAAELFTASGGDKQHAPRNIVKKLMNGGFSLTVTFWIFCVSVPLVGHLVFTRLLFPLLDLQSWHGSTAFLVWPLLALLYGLLASLGLWRSRAHFSGNPLWANLAGLAAILGALGAAAYAVMMAASWFMLAA